MILTDLKDPPYLQIETALKIQDDSLWQMQHNLPIKYLSILWILIKMIHIVSNKGKVPYPAGCNLDRANVMNFISNFLHLDSAFFVLSYKDMEEDVIALDTDEDFQALKHLKEAGLSEIDICVDYVPDPSQSKEEPEKVGTPAPEVEPAKEGKGAEETPKVESVPDKAAQEAAKKEAQKKKQLEKQQAQEELKRQRQAKQLEAKLQKEAKQKEKQEEKARKKEEERLKKEEERLKKEQEKAKKEEQKAKKEEEKAKKEEEKAKKDEEKAKKEEQRAKKDEEKAKKEQEKAKKEQQKAKKEEEKAKHEQKAKKEEQNAKKEEQKAKKQQEKAKKDEENKAKQEQKKQKQDAKSKEKPQKKSKSKEHEKQSKSPKQHKEPKESKPVNPVAHKTSLTTHQELLVCTTCEQSPLNPPFFRCIECQRFSICEKCETKSNHEHALLKIRNVAQMPVFVLAVRQDQLQKKQDEEQEVAGLIAVVNERVKTIHKNKIKAIRDHKQQLKIEEQQAAKLAKQAEQAEKKAAKKQGKKEGKKEQAQNKQVTA